MKPSINKFLIGACALCVVCFLNAACGDSSSVPAEVETVFVETEPQTPPVKVAEPANVSAANEGTPASGATTQPTAAQPQTAAENTEAVPSSAAKAQPSVSQSLYPNETIIRFKAWDEKLNTLKTDFEQTTFYDGVTINMSRGQLFYQKKGNLLRLDTQTPEGKTEQSAVTDKKQIIILDGQGRQITTLSWQEWQQGQVNQALFDFGNYTSLLARHHIEKTAPRELHLTPKEGETYSLFITLDENDFPATIKLVNDLTVTEAVLKNTQKNTVLDFEIFGGFF